VRVFVTGATGFVGRALLVALARRGDQVVALTRSERPQGLGDGVEVVVGSPLEPGPWTARLAGCDAVIHLAGETVGGRRMSRGQKTKIMDSRVVGTRTLVAALGEVPGRARPRVFLSANGVDFYPFDEGETVYTEDQGPGDSFLASVCVAWQREAMRAANHGLRVACLRTGVVLGRGGGALAKMLTPFRLGLGGPLGSGRQWFSWVHLDDAVGAYVHALARDEAQGAINLVSPEPCRQRDFARALGHALGRPAVAPLPGAVLRVAVGELAEYLLAGRNAAPRALLAKGYSFQQPQLAAALAELVSDKQAT
jgi:uncharacterized protein (TIGR01777 family)